MSAPPGLPVVAFLIRSLNRGGAESQLTVLARGLLRTGVDVRVVTFHGGGSFEAELRSSGITVVSLGKRHKWDILGPLFRLHRELRRSKAGILHSYLTDANVFAALVKPFLPGIRLVWGVRAGPTPLRLYGAAATISFYLSVVLSRLADLIIFNSDSGRRHHVAQGYRGKRMVVIPNGIDVERFRPDEHSRTAIRRAWNVAAHTRVIGIVARADAIKGHQLFLDAAILVAQRFPHLTFVAVGGGDASYKAEILRRSRTAPLAAPFQWEDERPDVEHVYRGLDFCVLSSLAEGFPNSVAEAMASGCICVAVRAGDSEAIVGECGAVVDPSPEALAQALGELLTASRPALEELRVCARCRIKDRYSVERLVDRTHGALSSVG